jgi:hypothetical protein
MELQSNTSETVYACVIKVDEMRPPYKLLHHLKGHYIDFKDSMIFGKNERAPLITD